MGLLRVTNLTLKKNSLAAIVLSVPCCRSRAVWMSAGTPAAVWSCCATASGLPRSVSGGRCSPRWDPECGGRCDSPTSGDQVPGEKGRQRRSRQSCRLPTDRMERPPRSDRCVSHLENKRHARVFFIMSSAYETNINSLCQLATLRTSVHHVCERFYKQTD